MKTIKAIIERSADGDFSIYMEDNSLDYAVIGTGDTIEKARADFEACYNGMRELYREEGQYFEEVKISYVIDHASALKYLAKTFTLVGLGRITGINSCQLSHYITGRAKPSNKTIQRINNGIHAYARELSALSL